jgi:hypothetical protein
MPFKRGPEDATVNFAAIRPASKIAPKGQFFPQ